MSAFEVSVERDGRRWLVHVPELRRTTTARNLGEVDSVARDLVSSARDLDGDDVELELHIDLPADARRHLAAARQLREQSARANSAAAAEARAAARALSAAGMSLRDVGQAMGVSYQRASQLLATGT